MNFIVMNFKAQKTQQKKTQRDSEEFSRKLQIKEIGRLCHRESSNPSRKWAVTFRVLKPQFVRKSAAGED